MRVERVFRLLGLVLGLIAGVYYASFILTETHIQGYTLRAIVLLLTALAGALFGFFGLPYVTTKPFFWLENKLNVTPLPDLVAATVGLLVGLLLAARPRRLEHPAKRAARQHRIHRRRRPRAQRGRHEADQAGEEARPRDHDERLQPQSRRSTRRGPHPQPQQSRQRAQAGRHPRRGDERADHQGGEGAEPGGCLPR